MAKFLSGAVDAYFSERWSRRDDLISRSDTSFLCDQLSFITGGADSFPFFLWSDAVAPPLCDESGLAFSPATR